MALLEKNVDRRSFFKGGAAAAAALSAAGLAACAPGQKETSLSGTGSDGLTAHVVESDLAILEERGEWVTGECWENCGGRCINRAYVVDDVVVRQKTDDMHEDTLATPQQRSCPCGHSIRQHVFNANRIKYPMKRKSWQPGGGANSHGELRGEEGWEQITWEEALDYVASELKRVYDDYGPTSVVRIGNEWKFLNLLGGALEWNSTESYGNWYLASTAMGQGVNGYYPDAPLTNDRLDLKNADTIVLYGTNPSWHSAGNPISYYREAKDAGAEVIVVGPDYNVSAAMLDARWIPVRPGTDTAFLLAVAFEMMRLDDEQGNVIDWEFLEKYCVGFDEDHMPEDATVNENFKDYVLGKYDGIAKDPAWATEICGASPEDIAWYASKMTKQDNVTIHHSYAPSRYQGSIDLPQLFMTIGCMGGHYGRPGNACGAAFCVDAANCGPRTVKLADASKVGNIPSPLERRRICGPELWKCLDAGKFYDCGAYSGDPDNGFLPLVEVECDPKILVNDRHNPLQINENINLGIKVFKKMDMVVDVHYRFTLTSEYSDIILPCYTPWEGNLDKSKGALEVSTVGSMRLSRILCNRDYILVPRPIVMPMYETRNEGWIYCQIMERLGLDPKELYPISDVQAFYDKIAGAQVLEDDGVTWSTLVSITQDNIDAWEVEGTPQQGKISLEELMSQGYYIRPRTEGDNLGYIAYQEFVEDPIANPRNSVSGKMEIYCQAKADAINGIGYAKEELKPYPTFHSTIFEKSFTNWDEREKGQYPFVVYQPHYLRRAHTQYDENVWAQEALQNPVFINAADAKELGIETGDTVLVFNETGKLLRHASVTNAIVPGALALPHGPRSNIDRETGIDIGGNENSVVGANCQDEFFPQCDTYNSCLVNIEKYDGDELVRDCERGPVVWMEG